MPSYLEVKCRRHHHHHRFHLRRHRVLRRRFPLDCSLHNHHNFHPRLHQRIRRCRWNLHLKKHHSFNVRILSISNDPCVIFLYTNIQTISFTFGHKITNINCLEINLAWRTWSHCANIRRKIMIRIYFFRQNWKKQLMITVKFSLTLQYELLFGDFLRIQLFIFPIIDGLVSMEFDYIYFKVFSRLNRLLLYYYCIISYDIACFIRVYQTSLKDPFLPCKLSQ